MILKEIKKIKVVVLVLSSKRAKEVRYIGLLFLQKNIPRSVRGITKLLYVIFVYIIPHKLSVYQALTDIDPVNVADAVTCGQ